MHTPTHTRPPKELTGAEFLHLRGLAVGLTLLGEHHGLGCAVTHGTQICHTQ